MPSQSVTACTDSRGGMRSGGSRLMGGCECKTKTGRSRWRVDNRARARAAATETARAMAGSFCPTCPIFFPHVQFLTGQWAVGSDLDGGADLTRGASSSREGPSTAMSRGWLLGTAGLSRSSIATRQRSREYMYGVPSMSSPNGGHLQAH